MNPTFCISTSTSDYPITVAAIPVDDGNGNSYYATTTCPGAVSTTTPGLGVVDFTPLVWGMGFALFLAYMWFIVWYFLPHKYHGRP